MKILTLILMAVVLSGCQLALPRLTDKGAASAPQTIELAESALSGPTLQVDIPSREAQAMLSRAAVNDDVETWLTNDSISLSYKSGVLVASRGLGFDLMGADAAGTLDALAGQDNVVYRRQMRYLTGDHRSTYLTAGCSMIAAGGERIGNRTLQRFEEDCQAHRHRFTNLFWLDQQGVVVRSRQWLSPEIGYVTATLL